jgi:hypothetical protein
MRRLVVLDSAGLLAELDYRWGEGQLLQGKVLASLKGKQASSWPL